MNENDIKFMQQMNGDFHGDEKFKKDLGNGDCNDKGFAISFDISMESGKAVIENYKFEKIVESINNCDVKSIEEGKKNNKVAYPHIVHIDYWKTFVSPNRFSVYYSDHTHIDIKHDESELCQNLINCIEKHGGLRGDYDAMYSDVFWLLLGLERTKTDDRTIEAVIYAIGKH